MLRLTILSLSVVLFFMGGTIDVFGQQPDSVEIVDTTAASSDGVLGEGEGTVTLTNWPASLGNLVDDMGRNAPYLLPKVDSLSLDYQYAAGDSASHWSFVFGWDPGDRVLYEGDVLSRRAAPSGLKMVNVELGAEVVAGGESIGTMIVAVDSMALGPFPSIYSFEVSVHHSRVFLDVPAEEARRALRQGVQLRRLVVERMGFVADGFSSSERSTETQDGQEGSSGQARTPRVYQSHTGVHVGWRVAPRPYEVKMTDGTRTVRPRGTTIGRASAERDSRSSREDGESDHETDDEDATTVDASDDDDEEHTSLQIPALGAIAAVGLFAYAGGTVGVYGRGDTPYGLAAGYTRPSGGIQFQASVNGAVIEDRTGQKLTLKALGFYDAFSARIQPALGVGVQLDPENSPGTVPSLSTGLAGNFGRFVLLAGFEVIQGTPEVGLTYNFRHGRTQDDRQTASHD